jgi:PD-(D/E)XK nuclease superfamily
MTIPARPYAIVKTGLPSVTQVLTELSKPGLSWAAAKETANFAVRHPGEWMHLNDDQSVDKLYKHHRGVWMGRASMGTLMHRFMQVLADGKEITPELVDTYIRTAMHTTKDTKLWWNEPYDKVHERVLGYVNGLEQFWQDFDPQGVASEVVVRYPGKYIGTADLYATLNDDPRYTLLDLKTTAQQDDAKGFYADSYTLQLHAYAYATERVHYDLDNGKVVEAGASNAPKPRRLGVLHLRGNTGYNLWELPMSDETFAHFMQYLDLHLWRRSLPKPRLLSAHG